MIPTIEDRLAVHELVAQYGHIIDSGRYERAVELFTDDAIYDVGRPEPVRGWIAIAAHWGRAGTPHPLAHHATNVVTRALDDGDIAVVFKGMGVRAGGRTGSVDYQARATRTADGWRFAQMKAERRVMVTD